MDALANLAVATVATAPSPATSGTSLTLTTGQGARFPAPPFNVTVWTASAGLPTIANAEIIRVTAASGDTWSTIARAQEGTTARSILAGDTVILALTKKYADDLVTLIGTKLDTTAANATYATQTALAAETSRATAAEATKAPLGAVLPSTVVNRTSAYTAAVGDFVQADVSGGAFTVTLPASPANGSLVAVKKVDSTSTMLTIAPSGGGTIDGDPTATTIIQWAGAVFEHIGSNVWRIIANMTTAGATGPQGPTGATGATGATGPSGSSAVSTTFFTLGTGNVMKVPQLATSIGGAAQTALVIYAMPFFVSPATTIVKMGYGAWQNGSAGGLVRLGIYSDSNGYPGSLLVDAGTVAADTGTQFVPRFGSNLATPLALSAGTYWAALVVQGTTTPTAPQCTQHNSISSLMASLSSSAGVAAWRSTSATVTGALPSTYPAGATAILENANVPAVYLGA